MSIKSQMKETQDSTEDSVDENKDSRDNSPGSNASDLNTSSDQIKTKRGKSKGNKP